MGKLEGSCVDSVVFKPFSLEDIEETVQNLLHTGPLQRRTYPSFKGPGSPIRRWL